jgi:hypothetical protein
VVTPILIQAIFILQVLLHCRLRGELFSRYRGTAGEPSASFSRSAMVWRLAASASASLPNLFSTTPKQNRKNNCTERP